MISQENQVKKVVLLGFLFVQSLFSAPLEEKPFVVVIPSYNNKLWYNLNIRSVLSQKYQNFRVIYVDDCSPDGTADKVEKLVVKSLKDRPFLRICFDDQKSKDIPLATEQFEREINERPAFFTLIENKNRVGALANLYRSIWSCSDNEIIITLDGDDWFSDPLVLKRLNETYSSANVWLTHGKMIEHPSGTQGWSEPIPTQIIAKNAFRTFKCPSHLRTFYAGLFKKIALDDLLYEDDFFVMTWDMAIMYPMIEMCGDRHSFISVPNYIYNTQNPINDNKVNAKLQRTLDQYIRGKTPYERIQDTCSWETRQQL